MGELPYRILMDNGMYSAEVEDFFADLGIEVSGKDRVQVHTTAAYNPQANKAERMHRQFKIYLKANIMQASGEQSYWPDLVQPFCYKWNSRRRSKFGGLSPFSLIYFSEPQLSIERLLSP